MGNRNPVVLGHRAVRDLFVIQQCGEVGPRVLSDVEERKGHY